MSDPIPITKNEMKTGARERHARITGDVVPMPGIGTMVYCSVRDEGGKLIGSAHVWVKNKDAAQPLLGGLAQIIEKNASNLIT